MPRCRTRRPISWNHRPEEEGITTQPDDSFLELNPVGITALKKKGLRLPQKYVFRFEFSWNHRPEEEGITTRLFEQYPMPCLCWNHRPEEEGITTQHDGALAEAVSRWNHRPEEEGITTMSAITAFAPSSKLESPP